MKSLGYKGPIIDAWKEAGVTYTGKEYLIGNEKISRKDAYLYVMKKRGWNDTAIKFFDWEIGLAVGKKISKIFPLWWIFFALLKKFVIKL